MGKYPREIYLDTETEDKLRSYLYDELVRHYFERQPAIDELKDFQTDYWATPSTEVRNFPFTRASNIVVPLTAVALEATHARTMTTLYAVRPFVSIKSRGPTTADFEKGIENWFDYELFHNVKIRKPVNDIILELEKFGTGLGKSGYEKLVKKAVRTDSTGRETEYPVIIRDGATLDPVPQANFLFPYSYKDPQLAPWVGEEHSRSPYEVKLMTEDGMFRSGTYEKSLAYIEQSTIGTQPSLGRRYERAQEVLEKREAHWPRRVDWTEIWCAFDVDKDGKEEEIVVHYHYQGNFIMSIRYNWHDDLHRPYRIGAYMPVENRWRGIGICKQSQQFQREVTTQHRQRLDNATIANMNMIKVHKLSGYGPKEPVFPGKMWFLDDMTHVESFKLGEIYQSSFANEQATLIYHQQRSGVNELTLGLPQVGTPGTATSDLTRIQEGAKKFDFSYMNVKNFLNELLSDVMCNIIQFGPKNLNYFNEADQGRYVKQLLTMSVSDIRQSILFEVSAAGQQGNRILDRQNWTQVAQLLQQYYMALLQLTASNPQMLQQVIQKGIIASTEAMKQILESFDIRNIDRLVVSEIEEQLLHAGNQPGGPGAVGNGNSGPEGNGNTPQGLDVLNKIASLMGTGGAPAGGAVQRF